MFVYYSHDGAFEIEHPIYSHEDPSHLEAYIPKKFTLECRVENQTNWKFCSWTRTSRSGEIASCKYTYHKSIDNNLWTYKKDDCGALFDNSTLTRSLDMENGVSNTVCKLEIDHATFEHEGYWDCALTLCKEPTARGCENPDGSGTSQKAKITVHVRIIYYLIKSILNKI